MQVQHFSPNEAVRLVKADSEWTMKASVGGMIYGLSIVLIFLNVLFFPVVVCLLALLQGYLVSTIHEAIADADIGLPKWKSWFELLIAGLTWMAIESLLFIMTLGVILLTLIMSDVLQTDRLFQPTFTFWAVTIWTLCLGIAALSSLFSTYRFAYFAERQEISAAFAFGEVLRRLLRFPVPLIQAWLLQIGLFATAWIIPAATVIGVFLLPSSIFLSQLIGARLVAQAWRLTNAESPTSATSAPQ